MRLHQRGLAQLADDDGRRPSLVKTLVSRGVWYDKRAELKIPSTKKVQSKALKVSSFPNQNVMSFFKLCPWVFKKKEDHLTKLTSTSLQKFEKNSSLHGMEKIQLYASFFLSSQRYIPPLKSLWATETNSTIWFLFLFLLRINSLIPLGNNSPRLPVKTYRAPGCQ